MALSNARFLYADPRGSIVLRSSSGGTDQSKQPYDPYGIPAQVARASDGSVMPGRYGSNDAIGSQLSHGVCSAFFVNTRLAWAYNLRGSVSLERSAVQ